MNLPNRKRVYPEEKEQRIILELEWSSVNQSTSLSELTRPKPSKWLPYTGYHIKIGSFQFSMFRYYLL